MKISSLQGNFKVIQTIKNRDELLVLGAWKDLVQIFGSSRTFLINQGESLFGIYLCKQECSEFINKLIQDIDYHEWENFKIDESIYQNQFRA